MISATKIKFEDFKRVSDDNKYWLWHLLDGNHHPHLEIKPLDVQPETLDGFHVFREIIEKTKIPVFQTQIHDVMDFVLYMDDKILNAIKNKDRENIGPIILAFNHSRLVDHTINRCYCSEGIINMLMSLNPEFVLNFYND